MTGVESAEWDRRYGVAELVWTGSANRFVVEELAGLAAGRALDLAAGEGRNAVWLAEQGWRVTAVDFSAVGLAKGRRLAEQRGVAVDWVTADLRAYQPPARAFDLVLIAYLQVRQAELAGVLHGARDALAAGGTLLVVGHDVVNLVEGVGGPQDPGVLYTPAAVAAELSGLDIRRAERVRRPVQTDAGLREAVDTLVHAVRPPAPADS
ncbi:MAG TPA: class I SAM-dependent methyltransferase [Mycobacteriales bacterium]|nr:class I SAM-dependent methyltransferase [Mycobacteriales bacterium]